MIRYVKLKNYKSLVNLYVDFMKTKTKTKNLILIYGENGIGKSNFATAFYTLNETMRTMSSIEMWKRFIDENRDELKEETFKELLEMHIKPRFKDTQMIIKDCKTIDSIDNMILEFGFIYKGKNGLYSIEMNDNEIVSEKLEYVLNKNQTYYFDLKPESLKVNSNIFNDKKYNDEFLLLLDKYWGKHSFLSILSYEIEDKKNGYIKKKISRNLYNVLAYLKTICTKVKGGNHSEFGMVGTHHQILANLDSGNISLKEEEKLNNIEMVLNDYFPLLYSDIKKVYYKRTYKDKYIEYNLIATKLIYNNLIDVDFSLESTGTQNILDLFPYFISACEGQTVIIDELDTGIHDLMVKSMLENLLNYLDGQMIITTHNTMLFESDIPNENIYVFNVDGNAEKELVPITDFYGCIHKNVNPKKKYISGVYGGIPIISDVDYNTIIENLK